MGAGINKKGRLVATPGVKFTSSAGSLSYEAGFGVGRLRHTS